MSENHDNDSSTPKKLHGFAAWSKERQREAASKGGKTAHALGTAHKFSGDEAREAGRRGGLAIAAKKRRMKEEAELKTFVEIEETTPR
jgi:general stress protein YciG